MEDFLFTPEFVIAQLKLSKNRGSFCANAYPWYRSIGCEYWIVLPTWQDGLFARDEAEMLYCNHPDATYQRIDKGTVLEIVEDYLAIIDPIEMIWGTV